MAKAKSKDEVREARGKRRQEQTAEAKKANKPADEARKVRNAARDERVKEERQKEIDRMVAAEEDSDKKSKGKVHTLKDKPGSGAGLKPGDLYAPSSNPGAAARVPDQPLQPESMQSHGKGIIYDKDLDNPPYDVGDPEEVDAPPSGSTPRIDKEAERKKAEKMTPRAKQHDPDNPTLGAGGRKDATASPNPIGSSNQSKNRTAGGSNSGIEP